MMKKLKGWPLALAAAALMLAILTVAFAPRDFDAQYANSVALEASGLSQDTLDVGSPAQQAVAVCGLEAYLAAGRYPEVTVSVYELLGCQPELADAIALRSVRAVPFIWYMTDNPDVWSRGYLRSVDIMSMAIDAMKELFSERRMPTADDLELVRERLRQLSLSEENLSEEQKQELRRERALFALSLVLDSEQALARFSFDENGDLDRLFLPTILHGAVNIFTGSMQEVERKIVEGRDLTAWDAVGVALEVALITGVAKAAKLVHAARIGKSIALAKGAGATAVRRVTLRGMVQGAGKLLKPLVKPTFAVGTIAATYYVVTRHPDLVMSAAYNIAEALGPGGTLLLVLALTVVFWPVLAILLGFGKFALRIGKSFLKMGRWALHRSI